MQVTFAIDDFGADEAAALQALAQGRLPEEADHLWGSILLGQPGQPPVALRDDLSTAALALCVDVPAQLRRSGQAELRIVGWPGSFSFVLQADGVHLSGSRGERAVFPQAELLDGLHACGLRLAAFMAALSAEAPQFDFSARTLAQELAAAGKT